MLPIYAQTKQRIKIHLYVARMLHNKKTFYEVVMTINNRSDFLSAQSSQKIQLVHLEASQAAPVWTDLGGTWSRVSDYFVVDVLLGGLSQPFSYDPQTSTTTISFDPSSGAVSLVYRFFFANHAVKLPWDLDAGELVQYLPHISKISGGSSKLDKDNTGISLEGDSNVTLMKDLAFWSPIYDKLYWSNQKCSMYDYNPGIDVGEIGLLFRGKIASTSWGKQTVSFKVKNFVYELRSEISLPLYSRTSRTDPQTSATQPILIPDSLKGKPVRRLYGYQEGLLATGISNVLSKYKCTELLTNLETTYLEKDYDNPLLFTGLSGQTDVWVSDPAVYSDVLVGDKLVIGETGYTVAGMVTLVNDNTTSDVTIVSTGGTATMTFNSDFDRVPAVGDTLALSRLSGLAALASQPFTGDLLGLHRILSVDTSVIDAPFITFDLSIDITSIDFEPIEGEISLVRSILPNEVTLSSEIASSFITLEGECTPNRPYRRMNRYYQLSEHHISEAAPLITDILGVTSVIVDDVANLNIGDLVEYAGQQTYILNISAESKSVSFTGALIGMIVGQPLTRLGVQKIQVSGNGTFIENSDFWLFNTDDGGIVKLHPMSERDNADIVSKGDVTFMEGSRAVYSKGKFSEVRARDFIRLFGTNETFEVLEKLSDDVILIDTLYQNSLPIGTLQTRQIDTMIFDAISDETKVVVDCYGVTTDRLATGPSVLTAPDVAKDLFLETTVADDIDDASFAEESIRFPHKVSIRLPESSGDKSPKMSEVIGKVNQSVLGSVYYDHNFNIKYKHINPDVPVSPLEIKDDDLLSDVKVKAGNTNLITQAELRYGWREYDILSDVEEYSQSIEYTSPSISLGALPKRQTFESWLLDTDNADIVIRRIGFQNERQRNDYSVSVPIKYEDVDIWDILALKTTDGFSRFGNEAADNTRLVMVNSISKDGKRVSLGLSDLGGIYARGGKVAADTAPDFSEADSLDKALYGYITDSIGMVETEGDIGTNVIS